ncbi:MULTISPECIES: cupin domain-containing protein [unclassified Nostoc]|uniref:cupin domain-containing protein n=1 Tax=unclassified Nostoc TaxID=2593658 RepID=UPI00187F2F99|nr:MULTISPECIES: cupin domain-containing protein [unclassified Nostoc]MBE8991925.1 cupin domain-containing protein [Nostoc sp. LEGE 12450]MCW5319256.1 cupin domain-containing protein [Nostoc sp. KVJ3]
MPEQIFINTIEQPWVDLPQFPGTQFLPLAEPVPDGSIHRLKMSAGTIIPVHIHFCDEYVYILSGVVETGGTTLSTGTFWFTPGNIRQGPHKAITDVELLTIRLGAMGAFELDSGL